MSDQNLGSFEELILLAVAALAGQAYGVSVLEELKNQAGKTVTLGAIHSTLYRLEDKGFLKSEMGAPTSERGGRRKRLFSVSGSGMRALEHARTTRDRMWNRIPDPKTT